jgi:microcystin-dependent protein
MATITGLTAARMEAIEAASIVDGEVVGDNLILTKYDASTINAGNVRGPTGSPGVTLGELNTALSDKLPVGMIVDYINTTPPNANWLAMTGQTVVGGQTSYAALWAVLPTAMKSGANIVMPDTRGRVSVGYNSSDTDFDAIGEVGGAKTHSLTEAQMPSHFHTGVSHSHTVNSHSHGGGTGNALADHSHTFSGTSGAGSAHQHGFNMSTGWASWGGTPGNVYVPGTAATPGAFLYNSGPPQNANIYYDNVASVLSDHQHTVNGGIYDESAHTHGYSGTTSGHSATHNHAVSAEAPGTNTASPATDSKGSGTAHNIMQPYITFLKIIKVL